MRITLKYMAQLKQAAGVSSETVAISGPCTAASILLEASSRHDEAFRRIAFDRSGQVQKAILLFLGEEQIRPDVARAFQDGDVITVLAPMAGGEV